MSYTVIATRYRPQTFDDLVGQEYVARTLKNAIGGGRVAHAFLFTGLRGVGKTSAARILAKALNCAARTDANPCNRCPSCEGISNGSSLDVMEIDGASNNSVDDVRRLREQVAYKPTMGLYRIYIIDEVHMFSGGAFNALLKTLEEPPPHVKFILATTEAQKVPPTIHSRCQRFDFKPITVAKVAGRMREILDKEAIAFDPGAIQLLAEAADGSMRDGLSLLDKMVSAFGSPLGEADVRGALGLVGRPMLLDTAAAVLAHRAEACLDAAKAVHEEGYDLKLFCQGLLQTFRDLVVVKMAHRPGELLPWFTDADLEKARAMVAAISIADLDRVYQGFAQRLHAITVDPLPRVALEMALVRLSLIPPLQPIEQVISRLESLASGMPAPAASSAPPPAAAPFRSAPPVTSAQAVPASHPAPASSGYSKPTAIKVDPSVYSTSEEAAPTGKPDVPPYEGPMDDTALDDAARWDRFLKFCEHDSPNLAFQLMQGRLRRMGEAEIFLEFKANTFGKLFEDFEKRQEFEEIGQRFFGRRYRLHSQEVRDDNFVSHQSVVDGQKKMADQAIAEKTLENIGVQNALREFKGMVTEVSINRLDTES